ncbi:MAG: hypothetical protein NC081_12255 [Roseburia sp.]|nr:hypothetical protein [Roseburia sp.]
MGGRGVSSGMSDKGKRYGSEYATVYQTGNIKFVVAKEGSIKAPMETMTNGRIYVTLGSDNEPKHITYYDKHVKRKKQIDLTHAHFINGIPTKPHTHKGYFHNEKGDYILSGKEIKMIDRIMKTWHNRRSKK